MRPFIWYILVIITTVCANAQTVQLGVVKEYNEKAHKTPLSGVELNVRSANSTISDKNGEFSLKFLTLKPGEKINVRRIEKLGYEIFNKEAIEQWNLNPTTPFVIIMCRSERLKKIRDNYERVSSESYARQLKKEETQLSKLKAEGKIKDREYEKKLYELHESYERQLDNLDNYVDRFSRLDLSELSETEQKIIELVQQGKIEDAIAKYEEQNYVDKYVKEVHELNSISQAIDQLTIVRDNKMQSKDSIYSAINRQIETLKIAGGRENFDKIKTILSTLANSDTTNFELQIKAGLYLSNQNDNEALIFLKRCERSDSAFLKAHALLCMSSIYMGQGDYDMANTLSSKCLDIVSEANIIEADLLVMSQISIINSSKTPLINNSDSFLNEKIISRINEIKGSDLFCNIVKAQAYNAICYSIYKKDSITISEKLYYINQALRYAKLSFKQADTSEFKEGTEDLLCSIEAIRLMVLFENGQDVPESEMKSTYETIKTKFISNPKKYENGYHLISQLYLKYLVQYDDISFLCHVDNFLQLLKKQGSNDIRILYDADDLISYINKIGKSSLAIKLYKELNKYICININDSVSSNMYAYLLYKISESCSLSGDEENHIIFLKESFELYSRIEENQGLDFSSTTTYFPMVLTILGSYYTSVKQYEKAIPLFNKAIKYNKQTATNLSTASLLYNYWDCAVCYLEIKDMVKSNEYLNRIIQLEGIKFENDDVYEVFAWAYCNLSWNEYETQNYEYALYLVNKGLNYKPEFIPLLDNKGLYLLKLGNQDEAISILKLIETLSNTETLQNTDLYKALYKP